MVLLRVSIVLLSVLRLLSTAIADSPVPSVKNGELWVGAVKITETGGKIDGFKKAHSGLFASAQKIIGYTEDHNDDLKPGEKPAQIPMYSVLIVDLIKKKILREITAPEELLLPGEWMTDGAYRFYTGSQLDVVNMYEYSIKTNSIRKIDL